MSDIYEEETTTEDTPVLKGLCTLSQVKTALGIAEEDTTQDAKLSLMIKGVSAKIEGFIGYPLERATYDEEIHAVNNRQLLVLDHFPIQEVESITVNGQAVTDYRLIPSTSKWGGVYRGHGWTGDYYTRGFTHDIVSGAYEILVTYDAGYYLPYDTEHYVEGQTDSLPYDITQACIDCVVLEYNFDSMGAKGLKAHTEGHISDTYADDASTVDLPYSAKACLSKYIKVGLA